MLSFIKGCRNIEKWRIYHQVLHVCQSFRLLVLVLPSCSFSHVTLYFIVRFGKLQILLVVFGKLQMFFSCISQMIEIGYWFQRNPREHPEAQLRLLNGILGSQKVAPKTNIVTSVTFLKFIAMVSTCALFNFKDCCRCQKVIAALI